MIFKFGVIMLASFVCRSSAHPPCVCTRNYQPVCGSDHHTYPNQCMLDCARASDHALTAAHQGQCSQASQSQPLCICTFEYNPVCGSDGQTYPNKCALRCQAARNPAVQLKHTGPCDQVKVAELKLPSSCACTRNLQPVCGTDGVTYNNLCLLECASQSKPLAKKADGPCEDGNSVKIEEEPEAASSGCACTRNLQPVCGTDGVTYSNLCLLECASQNKPLAKKADGPCEDGNSVKIEEEPEAASSGCACTRNLQPVCGTDGVTYNNLCLLKCASQNKPLAKKAEGPCEDSNTIKVIEQAPAPSECACTRNYLPTCGSDGQTYPNPCMLRCAQTNKPGLQLVHIGSCGEESQIDTVEYPDN